MVVLLWGNTPHKLWNFPHHLQKALKQQIEALLSGGTPSQADVDQFVASFGTDLPEEGAGVGKGGFNAVAMLQLVLDNIPVRVFWKDRSGTFLGCNRRLAEDMGLKDPKEIVGKDDYCFSSTRGQAEYFRSVDQEVMNAGVPRYRIREAQDVPGSERRWLETNKVPLHDETGTVIGLLGTYENITKRVRGEERLSRANAELARASRMKDQFLAGISHELRTPLNSILGLSEALTEGIYGEMNDRQISAIGRVEEGGRHLLALINDILDIAKFEAGEVSVEMQLVGVRQLCESSLSFVREQASKRSIAVNWSVDENIDFFFADERRIKQILINLLSNSAKFTEEGGAIEHEVTADANRTSIQFRVRDNGIGISEENLDQLFKPFRQIDSTLARAYNGAGLGLSLVKHMSELHGGSVSVESRLGEGSSFIVSIPWRTRFEEVREHDTNEHPALNSTTLKRKRSALVIEDCAESAEQISRYLEESEYEVSVVETGELALLAAVRDVPDLIILDILLPGISGWTVLERLRKNQRTSSVPVVIVSVVDERENSKKCGADGYIVKPIGREIFFDGLERSGVALETRSRPTAVASHEPVSRKRDKPWVLLAEDNEENIRIFSEYLTANKIRIFVAKNGVEAIEGALKHEPDLILMDVQMPVMDGLEAIRRIRADVFIEASKTEGTVGSDVELCAEW
jgi:PAS domain S-box-containing protein